MKRNKNKMYLNLDLLYNVFDYMTPLYKVLIENNLILIKS